MRKPAPDSIKAREALLLLADLRYNAGASLGSLINRLGNLEHTAGAVACGIQTRYIGSHLLIHQDAVALGGSAQLLGQVGVYLIRGLANGIPD